MGPEKRPMGWRALLTTMGGERRRSPGFQGEGDLREVGEEGVATVISSALVGLKVKAGV